MKLTVQELYSASPEEIREHWKQYGYEDDTPCIVCLIGRISALNALVWAIIAAAVGGGWFMALGAFITVFGLTYLGMCILDKAKARSGRDVQSSHIPQ